MLQICPQLYCDMNWYVRRRVAQAAFAFQGFQLRPSLAELEILSQMDVLQAPVASRGPIKPIMTHPNCKKFYGDGPRPMLVSKRTVMDKARVRVDTAATATMDTELVRSAPQPYRPHGKLSVQVLVRVAKIKISVDVPRKPRQWPMSYFQARPSKDQAKNTSRLGRPQQTLLLRIPQPRKKP